MRFPKVSHSDRHLYVSHGKYARPVYWLRQSDPAKNIASEKFITHLKPIQYFDDLVQSDFSYVLDRTLAEMELYTPKKRAAFDRMIEEINNKIQAKMDSMKENTAAAPPDAAVVTPVSKDSF